MANFYGIESLGALTVLTTHREAGYTFIALTDLKMLGCRLYTPTNVENIKCTLWDSAKTVVAECTVGKADADEWVEAYFTEPVPLTIGNSYTISAWIAANRYRANISEATISHYISVVNGCYTAVEGAYPDSTAATIYQIIDGVFEDDIQKLYYGKVLFPEIPLSVLADNPYCWIRKNESSGYYDLFFSPTPFYLVDSSSMSGSGVSKPWYRIAIANVENAKVWEYYKDSTANLNISETSTVLWSNTDIPVGSADGTEIYFKGTPPRGVYSSKYLIRSGSTLYTVTDGALSALTETEVTASLFQTYGVDEIPDGSLLVGLTDPEVLYWQDSNDDLPTLTATVKGTPPLPQVFTSAAMDMTHESIAGINYAEVDASEDVRFAISFDDGATWNAFDGAAWFAVSDSAPGMLASTMNAITAEQWAQIVTLTAYRLRFWLPNVTAYVKSVVMHYINP